MWQFWDHSSTGSKLRRAAMSGPSLSRTEKIRFKDIQQDIQQDIQPIAVNIV